MAARMEKTRTAGVFKRGSRYVATWYANGKTYKRSARTLDEARRIRNARLGEVAKSEFHAASRLRLREYAEEWIERYRGRGRNGFRESTRDDYRRDLKRYAYPYLDGRLGRRLAEISPRDISNWIDWMCDDDEQTRRRAVELGKPLHKMKRVHLSDGTVRRVLAPLRACLATARQEDLIRHNPADGATLPHRPRVEDQKEPIRALTRKQLATFLRLVPANHATFFRFLAATGLRWSEMAELRWSDLHLDGSRPHVSVRRAFVRGRIGPPKSKHASRDVPLGSSLVFELRRRRRDAAQAGDGDLVFASAVDEHLDHSNLRRRVLRPIGEEAGVPWIGFHTFRHTCASLLFDRGANAVKVQRWLGHHSPAFTLDTYVHLLDDQVDEPLDLVAELDVATKVGMEATETGGNDAADLDEELGALTPGAGESTVSDGGARLDS